ncbi:ATP-binding protein, partial [Pseudoalteromonas ruthenica]
YRNLNRAADLISSFKRVAVSQDLELSSDVNITNLLTNIITAMNADIAVKQPVIDIQCADGLTISSKSGPLQQVFEQLISNSLLHAFKGIENNSIDINISRSSNQLSILYTDNGCGVPNSIRKRIFDPFVTTKRGEGG